MLPPRCHGEPGTLLWLEFLQAGCPSCHLIKSVKELWATTTNLSETVENNIKQQFNVET